jgi:outer membrane protein
MLSVKLWLVGLTALLFLMWVPAAVVAGEDETELFTLEDSIAIAVERSLQIRSAREALRGARATKKEAFTSFLPTFNTQYRYRRINETPTTMMFNPTAWNYREVPVGTRDNYTWSLEVAQPLFAGGAITGAYEIAGTGVDISKLEQRTVIQDVILQVRESYVTILKAERVRDVADQSVELLESHRKMTESFYDEGVVPRNDLLYAEVELANGIQNRMAAENALELAKARFNTLLRRPISAAVEVEDILSYHPFEKNLEECLSKALELRPELATYELQVHQAEQAIGVAKSGYYPTVSVLGNYSRYGDDPGVSGNNYVDQEDWYVMAVADWNFWEWGKTRHGVEVSRSRLEQAKNALENVRDMVSLEVKNAYLNMREAEKRIFVAEKAVIQAEENYRLNVERYNEQVGTTTEVIDAQTLLTRARSDYFNALSNYHLDLGELERSMGVLYGAEQYATNE